MSQQSDWFGDVLKIAIGIAIGGVILWALRERYYQYQFDQVAHEISKSVATMHTDQQKEIENQRQIQSINTQAKLVEQRNRQQRDQAEIERQRLLARKEQAWRDFYKPSAECQDTSRSDLSIECGNAYIRAKRQFEASWTP